MTDTPLSSAPSPPIQPLSSLQGPSSLLSLACDDKHVYAGGDSTISVYSLTSLGLVTALVGHNGAVLSLVIASERHWLCSSGADHTARIWSTSTLQPLWTINALSSGSVFSLAWLPGLGALYMGAQDTSISWIHPPAVCTGSASHGAATPSTRSAYHRFFDSQSTSELVRSAAMSGGRVISRTSSSSSLGLGSSPPAATTLGSRRQVSPSRAAGLHRLMAESHSPPTAHAPAMSPSSSQEATMITGEQLELDERHVVTHAHFGYIYALAVAQHRERDVLVSGDGDGDLKVWTCTAEDLTELKTLEGEDQAVLGLAIRDNTVFAAHQGGAVRIWDIDTLSCIRTLKAHTTDVLSVSVTPDALFSCSASGGVQRWTSNFTRDGPAWLAHSGTVLASIAKCPDAAHSRRTLFTGGSDSTLKIWDVSMPDIDSVRPQAGRQGRLFSLLSELVTFPTVSTEEHREDCRQGALHLKRALGRLGANAVTLPGAPGRNPLVLATFSASSSGASGRRRCLFYGHYDVVKPGRLKDWTSDPWTLTGRDEWVYGRGVSDNKGPTLAFACAAAELLEAGKLDVDLVMLIEGEEEAGSVGFEQAVLDNRAAIGPIDVVALSNSYWLGTRQPCMTFGLRGVIHATVKVSSTRQDLHSGQFGGSVDEPMADLVRLLSSLLDDRSQIKLAGFYDAVRPLESEEKALYDELFARLDVDLASGKRRTTYDRDSLMKLWRHPSLSIHNIEVSGPSHSTVIPRAATATVSMRIVPDQDIASISSTLVAHLRAAFAPLQSTNTLSVAIDHTADWWLGRPGSAYSRAFADAIEAEWQTRPLWIREGGSIPTVRFLERTFGCEAVHFPIGQATDAAHLPNERIRILNIEKAKSVVRHWLSAIAHL